MSHVPLVQLSAGARVRLALFGMLERVSDLRGNAAAGRLKLQVPARPEPALWVYVSTIGELNAIGPLLRQLCERLPDLRLVLITNHGHYEASYRAQYPDAAVCVTLGHADDAETLGRHFPPRLLLVGEIPCLPSDAPCRFSVAFAAAAKRHGAFTAVANGWLYGDQPACRMDSIERRLLGRTYLRSFDAICMQMAEGRDAMITAGADPARVHVTGNIKFDAMVRAEWAPSRAKSSQLVQALVQSGRPIVVAGCVTNESEQRLVIEAFNQLLATEPSALLILAPRHPEVRERIESLAGLLRDHGHAPAFRTITGNNPLGPEVRTLVLDTMGELRDFYALATVAHVGVDHNLLEPLTYGKAVTMSPGWNSRYPSYPVYRLLADAGALAQTASAAELARAWARAISHAAAGRPNDELQSHLAAAKGAVERHLNWLEPAWAALRVRAG